MFSLLLAIIYISFISLGLPDALLGAAWPTMYPQLGVPVSYAGAVAMIISAGSIMASLQSDRLTLRLGAGKVTAISVALTAAALLGFSFSTAFWQLCLWAVPYGLGAGSVDAALNNYAALHFKSSHMSWLHCMWGIGATAGPYVMGFALTGGLGWGAGYRIIGAFQVLLAAIIIAALPLWKKSAPAPAAERRKSALTIREILKIKGSKAMMLCFFSYSAVEQGTGLWVASYLSLERGIDAEVAASLAGMFFLGITLGRAVCGFISMRLSDKQLTICGFAVIAAGIALMAQPFWGALSVAGLVLIGLGCAPVYPCMIHVAPALFGADKSQAIIGVQMASGSVGCLVLGPLFGLIASHISVALLPAYVGLFLVILAAAYLSLYRKEKIG